MPVKPLSDVVTNVGTAAPAQMIRLLPKLKTGTMFCVTVTVKVVVTAHCPELGVKV